MWNLLAMRQRPVTLNVKKTKTNKKKQPWKILTLTRGKTQLYKKKKFDSEKSSFLSLSCLPYQLINRGERNQFSPTAVVVLQGAWRWKLFSLTSACHFYISKNSAILLYCLSFQSRVSGWNRADMVFPLEFFTFTAGIETVLQVI